MKSKNSSIGTKRSVNTLGSPNEENEEGLEHGERTKDYSNANLKNALKSIQNDKRDAYKTRVAFGIPGSTPEDYIAKYLFVIQRKSVFSPKDGGGIEPQHGPSSEPSPRENDPRSIIKT
jgi:hypothetical protein